MRKYLAIGFIVAFLGFIIWKYSEMFSEINNVRREELPSSKSFLPEDSTFFSPLLFHQISVDEIYISNIRPSVGFYYFQNKFHLIKCKIPVTSNKDLNTILKTEKAGYSKSEGVVYKTIFDKVFSFNYIAELENYNNEQMLLGIDGDSTTILQNDATIYYINTRLKNLSLRYRSETKYDVIINTNSGSPIHAEVLIMKKDTNYFLCMLISSEMDKLPSNLLKSLINL